MNVANTLPALETPEASPHAMKFTYASGDRPLEGYTIKRGVGRGGFGEVYYAVSDGGKEVALKLVQRNLDVELRGVGQCLNVKHPNLVTVYDVRQNDDGEYWIVMEYMAGTSLDRLIDEHPAGLPPREATRWLRGIAAAVDYLHDRGVVHRDLKPANIFIEDGQVKIGDYGLAKFVTASRRSGHTESVGTVHYMAPELAQGRYSKEIDLYALGVILYEMLTGQVPFDGESVGEILMKHLTAEPELTRVPETYRPVVGRLLAKDPGERYTTARAMLEDLACRTGNGTRGDPTPEETVAHRAPSPHESPSKRFGCAMMRRKRHLAGAGCQANWGPTASPSRSIPAGLVGAAVGFLLFGCALAGGVPEAAPFAAVGGGLLAGVLTKNLRIARPVPDDASLRPAKMLAMSVGLLAFGMAMAGGVPEAAPFLAVGAGLLTLAIVPALPARFWPYHWASAEQEGSPTAIDAGVAIRSGDSTPDRDGFASPAAPDTAAVGAFVSDSPAAPRHGRPIRKVIKFLGWTVILGFVFVLLAGILAVMGVWMLFDPHITQDPVAVEEMTAGITEINVLDGLVPRFAAGENFLGSKLAVYTDPESADEDRFLLLMAFPQGGTNLPTSVQNWLEEELAVVRPRDRSGPLQHRPLPERSVSDWGPALGPSQSIPGVEVALPDVVMQVPGPHRTFLPIRFHCDEAGSIPLFKDFSSTDDTQRAQEIRGKDQMMTVRKGTERDRRVVRVFAPFEAKGEKPALLVFGTPEARWDEQDSKEFDLMLESMK